MSGSIEPKAEPSALNEPAPTESVRKGLWSTFSGTQKLALIAGGSVLAVVAGTYAAKQFSPTPGKAVAQSAETKPAEPEKLPPEILKPTLESSPFKRVKNEDPSDELPRVEIKKPVDKKKTVDPLDDLVVPGLKPEEKKKTVDPLDDLVAPGSKPDDKKKLEDKFTAPKPMGEKPTESFGLKLPPTPGLDDDKKSPGENGPAIKPVLDEKKSPGSDLKAPSTPMGEGDKKPLEDEFKLPEIPGGDKKKAAEDPFKAPADPRDPAPLPTTVIEKTEKPTKPKIIQAGGQDTNPKKDSGSDLILTIPDAKPTPAKKDALPEVPEFAVPPLPDPTKDRPLPPPNKANNPVVIVPGKDKPKEDPPAVPMLDPIEIKPVEIKPATPKTPEVPTLEIVPKPAETKRDAYEEDWHTPEGSQTYTWISNFYYKSADYAKALEAYNREKRRPGETIVRVPPTWVLDEKFPDLTGKTGKVPELKPTSGLKFEPVETSPKPAPATASDEYRVTAEAGETIREIAGKVLGDSNAWQRLYKLNSNIDPTLPIPTGTVLRLPR